MNPYRLQPTLEIMAIKQTMNKANAESFINFRNPVISLKEILGQNAFTHFKRVK